MNRSLTLALAASAALWLAACDRGAPPADPTVGQRVDQGIAQAGEALRGAGDAVREAGQTVADSARDAAITAKVNAELARDDKLSALKINVDTVDGRVALQGKAPDASSVARATQLAAGIEGVVAVDNRLTVDASS